MNRLSHLAGSTVAGAPMKTLLRDFAVLALVVLAGCGRYASVPAPAAAASTEPVQPAGSSSPPRPPLTESGITKESYPRVDGSTSTHPLQVLLACRILGVRYQWVEDRGFRERRVRPLIAQPSDRELATFVEGRCEHHGTHDAYVNLIEGKADLIFVAREPSVDELALAGERHVELRQAAIASDAFIFIVNEANPVRSLSLGEIRDIYAGRITLWSEVGGGEGKIHAYQRDRNSGSQELMDRLVMQGTPMMTPEDANMVSYTMSGPINAVTHDTLALGYSVYYYEQFMTPKGRLVLCGVDGVTPDRTSIGSGTYPLTAQVYAVIRGDLDASSTAAWIYTWLQTETGQTTVAESGYVPLPPQSLPKQR